MQIIMVIGTFCYVYKKMHCYCLFPIFRVFFQEISITIVQISGSIFKLSNVIEINFYQLESNIKE